MRTELKISSNDLVGVLRKLSELISLEITEMTENNKHPRSWEWEVNNLTLHSNEIACAHTCLSVIKESVNCYYLRKNSATTTWNKKSVSPKVSCDFVMFKSSCYGPFCKASNLIQNTLYHIICLSNDSNKRR